MGFGTPSVLTISSYTLTVTGTSEYRSHLIKTENLVESDNVTTINGGNVGELLMLRPHSDFNTVIFVKSSTLRLQTDFVASSNRSILLLHCAASGLWEEVSRSTNEN